MDISHSTYNLTVINARDLVGKKIKSPDCQRLLDVDHVNDLIDFQKKHYDKYGEFFFTNPITICVLNNKEYIIDGQHRLQCIKTLLDVKGYNDIKIYLTTIYAENEDEMEEKYIAINKNKPVQLFDNLKLWKLFYKKIEQYITKNYKKYLSDSKNPRTPNFNVKDFLDYLDNNKIADKINFNANLFIVEFEKLNDYYKDNITILYKVFKNNINNKIVKSKEKQKKYLLLSLFKNFEWVDRISYVIENKLEYKDISHYPKEYRVKIKKLLRKEVWKKRHIDSIKGECFCCSKIIEYDDFECGHIKSVHYKGETTLSNLEPICSMCNNDMGIQNLIDYKNELRKEFM